MGQIVGFCKKNNSEDNSEVMAAPHENGLTSQTEGIPEVFSSCTCAVNIPDQYEVEKQMAALENMNVTVILTGVKTFRVEGQYLDVDKAIEQLKALKKKHNSENTEEEKKEQTSDNCDPAKPKKGTRVLRKDLTPRNDKVDLSLSQRLLIDPHVWYYVTRKQKDKLESIAQQHLCVMKVVCDSSNEGITHNLEVAPYARDDSTEASKHVDDAVEEFAQLYQKISEPRIFKESISIPVSLDQSEMERLIAELEAMDVFFLRSEDPCLVGPKASIEKAKQKVSDFVSGRNNSSEQVRPNDNFNEAQTSADDRVQPLKFKTSNGLTVHVAKGDLVHQTLDAIVNPANERLGHGGGAARAIADAAGYVLTRESKEYIRDHGELGITHVMHTSAGKLRPKIKYVIHTVGPRKSKEHDDDNELFGLVKLTVFNCLQYANDELKIHSVAIPAISSGIFGVPIEIVGRASYEALKIFNGYYASSKKKSLREIHFLNKDLETFSNMKRIFESLFKDDRESSVDPELPGNIDVMGLLDQYADIFGRQRIETTTHDNCFTRAFTTTLQKDLQTELDWRKVDKIIRKELDNNKNHYQLFRADKDTNKETNKGETNKEWSFADVVMNPMDAFDAFASNFWPMSGDKEGIDPDVWISAAANAFYVQIILVHLSEKMEPVERNIMPRSTPCDKTVYIAYHCCGHYHFDALVRKSSREEMDPGKKLSKGVEVSPAGDKKNSSSSNHSYDNGTPYEQKNDDGFEKLSAKEALDMPPDKALDVAAKKSTKEKAVENADKDKKASADVAGKKDDKAADDKKEDDDNHCIICMDDITDKKELGCKHKFCRECIDDYFTKCQPKCPSCGKVFGILKGDQPKGTMTTKEKSWHHLHGYDGCGTIEIEYSFHNGTQGEKHPNPGQPYKGTHRTAYLPANKEGREVLRLLRRAFDAGLVFTIGRSNTTGQDNVVIWNDVHHKTSTSGQYGYPDATYLKRVTEELAAKGIQ